MLSTMISVASTIMPKSMDPSEIKFADCPIEDHHRKGKQQRQRNGQCHDQGRAQMPQKDKQDDEDQHHAADENIRDGLDRRMDQGRAIVEGFDLDAGRQLPLVQVLNFFSNLLKDIERLVSPLQQNDAFDDIVAVIDADLAQTNPGPDGDRSPAS